MHVYAACVHVTCVHSADGGGRPAQMRRCVRAGRVYTWRATHKSVASQRVANTCARYTSAGALRLLALLVTAARCARSLGSLRRGVATTRSDQRTCALMCARAAGLEYRFSLAATTRSLSHLAQHTLGCCPDTLSICASAVWRHEFVCYRCSRHTNARLHPRASRALEYAATCPFKVACDAYKISTGAG